MIRNNGPYVRVFATKHHVATGLSAKDEPGALEGGTDFAAGEIGRKLGHVVRLDKASFQAASTSTNSLPASVGTGSPASRQSST